MKKLLLSCLLAVTLLCTAMLVLFSGAVIPDSANGNVFASSALAAEAAEGSCGSSLTWALTKEGVLTISGTGAMTDFAAAAAPWNSASVKIIVIKSGVTGIGSNAFADCSALVSVTIPSGVTSIGENAFAGCKALTDVYYTGSEAAMAKIDIADGNDKLTGAAVRYNAKGTAVTDCTVTLSKTAFTYNNDVQKPTVTVKNPAGKTISNGISYSVSYSSGCSTPGTYSVTVRGTGNYYGTVIKTFTIAKQPLDASRITLSQTEFTYNSNVQKPAVTVKNLVGKTVSNSISYKLSYSTGCMTPGNYTVTITGIGSYTGTVTKSFTIAPQPLDESLVTLSQTEFTYNSAVQKPAVTVKNAAGKVLNEKYSYTSAYSSGCMTPGTYKVTVTGKGSFTGTVTKTFTIAPQPLDESRVTLSQTEFTYNSAVQKPTVTVKNALGKTVSNGTSYKVSYSSGCMTPGTYKVTVTGMGSFTGTVIKTFTIKPQPLSSSLVTLSQTTFDYNNDVQQPEVTVKNAAGKVLNPAYSYTVTYPSGCKTPGTYKVTVTGKGSFTGTVTKTFTIGAQPLDESRVTLSKTVFTYNSNVQKPTVTVKNLVGTTISSGISYKVSYATGCMTPGIYKVTVTGTGSYKGTVDKYFTINPQPLDEANVTLSQTEFDYNNDVQQPEVTVKNAAGKVLNPTYSYTVKYSSGCKTPGTYKVTVTGKGSFSGTVTKTFTIGAQPLDESRVTLSNDVFIHNGTAQKPTVTVKNVVGTTVSNGISYTVSYSSDCIEPGTYNVTVTGTGSYKGTVTKTFEITHDWDEGTVTQPATCTEKGVKEFKCLFCEAVKTAETDELGHEYADEFTVDTKPACSEEGIQSRHCIRCEAVTDVTPVPPTGHTPETDEAVPATCTKTGLTEGSHCSVCSEVLTAQEEVPVIPHSFTNYVSDGNATCTSDGTKTAVCDYGCGEQSTVADTGTKLAHDFTGEVKTNNDGTHSYKCTGCDEYGAAASCTYSSSVTKPATCSEKGEITYTCDTCGYIYTEELPLTAHTEVTDAAVPATCTETGLTEGSHCSVCGTVIKAPATVKALGHSYSSTYTTDKAATCTEKGSKSKHCTRPGCTATTSVTSISSLGHSYINKVSDEYIKTSPTCTADGYYYKSCSICGIKYSLTFSVSKLGHDYTENAAEKYLVTSATCTAAAVYRKSCSRCGLSTSSTFSYGSALGHNYTENAAEKYLVSAATCTEKAVYYSSCSRCHVKGTTTFTSGSELGHSYTNKVDDKYFVSAATCTEKAVYYSSCSRCGVQGTSTFATGNTLGHNYVNNTDAKYMKSAADCLYPAVYYKSCSRCGLKDTTIFSYGSALGHNYSNNPVPASLKSAATCTAAAVYYESCLRCGTKTTNTFSYGDMLPHSFTGQVVSNNDGTHSYKCTGCDAYGNTGTCSFTSQTRSDEYVKKAATCTAPAEYYYKCTVCPGKSEEYYIYGTALGHVYLTVGADGHKLSSPDGTEICCRAGCPYNDKVAISEFNKIAKDIKDFTKPNNNKFDYFLKNSNISTCDDYDFGLLTSMIKDEFNKEMNVDNVSFSKLYENQSALVIPVRFSTKASELNIGDGEVSCDILEGLNLGKLFGTAYDGAGFDISSYKQKSTSNQVLKLTAKINEENFLGPNGIMENPTAQTALQRFTGEDIRNELSEFTYSNGKYSYSMTEETEDEDFYSMTMTLEQMTSSGEATYYLDAATLTPILIIYHTEIKTATEFDVSIRIIANSIDGNMHPVSVDTDEYVFINTNYFN